MQSLPLSEPSNSHSAFELRNVQATPLTVTSGSVTSCCHHGGGQANLDPERMSATHCQGNRKPEQCEQRMCDPSEILLHLYLTPEKGIKASLKTLKSNSTSTSLPRDFLGSEIPRSLSASPFVVSNLFKSSFWGPHLDLHEFWQI